MFVLNSDEFQNQKTTQRERMVMVGPKISNLSITNVGADVCF